MTYPTNDNDIDALLRYLLTSGHTQHWNDDSTRWRAAITALVAERDTLRFANANAKTYWRERAERRDAEEKSAADRDLRERLVCAALTGLCADPRHHVTESLAVAIADRTLAAMRKGATDGK